ncbi:MAG: FAD-dependent oxidoreductase [Bacilli bacterium]|nr:FAD-dependent oxidoreductase [Bacilli bacterium]
MFDIVIIGAGITGTLIARELSRYHLKVGVIEKCNDVGNATTNANSAIIHSGYDPVPGTLKAKFNVLGNPMYDQLTKELNVPFYRLGSLTVAIYDEQIPLLKDLAERSKVNGVPVQLLNKEEVLALEPNINPNVKMALFAPTCGIIDPFNLTVRAMENAIDNGVTLLLSEEVINISKEKDIHVIHTKKNRYEAKIVINCAGNYADNIASMIEPIDWSITPRKGEYYVLDHYKAGLVNRTIFPLPSEKGKGILVSVTTSGNYIVGPSSEPVPDKDDVSTDALTLKNVKEQALDLVPSVPFNQVIRTFSGLRPSCSRHDFIIEYAKTDKTFINVAGIESPGIASSPAIAKYVVNDLVKPLMELKEKEDFNPNVRKVERLYYAEQNKDYSFINSHENYSEVICSCEKVTLGEIMDQLNRSCPPHSVKGVKRRTRAGFGKCQGGFCQSKIVLLLAKHYGVSPLDIPLDDEGSNILLEKVKD